MKVCSASFCDSSSVKNNDLIFHAIPKNDLERRKKWIKFCKQPADWSIPRDAYLCSKHFRAIDYEEFFKHNSNGVKKKLLSCVIPSIVTRDVIKKQPVVKTTLLQRVQESIDLQKTEETQITKPNKSIITTTTPVVKDDTPIETIPKRRLRGDKSSSNDLEYPTELPPPVKKTRNSQITKTEPKINIISDKKPEINVPQTVTTVSLEQFNELKQKVDSLEKQFIDFKEEIIKLKEFVSKQSLEIYKKDLYINSLEATNKINETEENAEIDFIPIDRVNVNKSKKRNNKKKKSGNHKSNNNLPRQEIEIVEIDSILGI